MLRLCQFFIFHFQHFAKITNGSLRQEKHDSELPKYHLLIK